MRRFQTKFLLGLALLAGPELLAQNALHFDGTDDKMNCGTSSQVNVGGTAFSIEAWVYANAWPKNIFEGSIVLKENNSTNGGFMLRAGDNGRVGFGMGAGNNGAWSEINTASSHLSLNTWHHLAATYDGTYMRLYVDGTQVDSLATTINVSAGNSIPLTVGYHPTYGRYWSGKIDEVRLWNHTLSKAEINAHKDEEFCAPQSGLRAYYKMNQGNAGGNNTGITSVTDLSGFNNSATLTGFAMSGSTSNWVSGASLDRDSVTHHDTLTNCGGFFDPKIPASYTKSGIYTHYLKTPMGCDSVLVRHITILQKTQSSFNMQVCDSFQGPAGAWYTTSGTYQDVLTNAAGCDSTITLYLKVGTDTGYVDTTVCYTYQTPAGNFLSTPGTHFAVINSSQGCDSVIRIDLSIRGSSSRSIQLEYCDSVQSPSGKYWIKSDGIYKDTLVTQYGCDSLLSITAIGLKTYMTLSAAQCDPYTTPKGQVLTQSGTYYDTLINRRFCDSVITIHFTRYEPSYDTTDLFGCRSVLSVNGVDVFTTSGTYQTTLVNHNGCDSLVTMHVTVHNVTAGIQDDGTFLSATVPNATYRWLNCDNNLSVIPNETGQTFTPSVFGTYAVEITEMTCMDTSECLFFSGTGLNNLQDIGVRIYPNPASAGITVQSDRELTEVWISLYTTTGVRVWTEKHERFSQEHYDPTLPAGVYFLRLESREGSYIQKLIWQP